MQTCQQLDLPMHKLLCSSYLPLTQRPSLDHRIAIYFPENSAEPKLVKLRFDFLPNGSTYPDLSKNGDFSTHVEPNTPFVYNAVLNRNTPNTICLLFRRDFMCDGSKPNRSITSIVTWKTLWRGAVIAFGFEGIFDQAKLCVDLTMADFRHIIDFLEWNGNCTYLPVGTRWYGTYAEGVRIACAGEQDTMGSPRFEAVRFPLEFPDCNEEDPMPIVKLLGIPIKMYQLDPQPPWADDKNFAGRFINEAATCLTLSCTPDERVSRNYDTCGWGKAPKRWQDSAGSAVVVRRDSKPWSVKQMAALSEFCQFTVRRWFARSNRSPGTESFLTKDQVLGLISRNYYESWLLGVCGTNRIPSLRSENHGKYEFLEGEEPLAGEYKNAYPYRRGD
ncbi:MAG: hypothetical protein M1829_006384 [Trizodia sp. TS-e1964]|nr:MAG: hypothetical protein M1829_006384 [Trizodia sp. TS-e1964]